MKPINSIFSRFVLVLLLLAGCSKDKDQVKKPDEDVLKIEGRWKFEKLDFLDESVAWDPQVDFNTGNSFGYAPLMFGGMQGFEFGTRKVKGDLGNKFNFINEGDHNQDEASEYWYWNYTDDHKGFEIKQINSQMPPFDFSVMSISDITVSNSGAQMVLRASLNSRKPGGALTDMVKVPVQITLIKGTPDAEVQLFIKAQPFEMPKPMTTREKLMNTHWKLKPGSEVYDPGFSDQDPEKEYLKLVALSLKENDMLDYRYSFPMGIVSVKSLIQDALDKDTLRVKQGGSYGAPEQIISWKIESIDKAAKAMKLKEAVTGEVRAFVLIDDINDNNEVKKTDYEIITE